MRTEGGSSGASLVRAVVNAAGCASLLCASLSRRGDGRDVCGAHGWSVTIGWASDPNKYK
uniref:Uncharacterized protein n=1 Tax=Oryza rufipogon TaxID=4529 RepID=A0A0E0NWS3_ORYRU